MKNQEEELSLMLASIEAYDASMEDLRIKIDRLTNQRTTHTLSAKDKANNNRNLPMNFPENLNTSNTSHVVDYSNQPYEANVNNWPNSNPDSLNDLVFVKSMTTVTTTTATATVPLNRNTSFEQVSHTI